MGSNGVVAGQLPLSVLLFHAAMSRRQSMSEFAESIEVGALSLRQFLLGKTQRPRTKTLELIGIALGMSVEDVRDHMEIAPRSAPFFSDWLQEHMDQQDYSRARLAKTAKVSDGALKNYLQGQTLPDAEQAQKLADTLGVEPLDIAAVIVANHVMNEGGITVEPAPEGDDDLAPAMIAPLALAAEAEPAADAGAARSYDEEKLLGLWRRLHPQSRRAVMIYIADLLSEG